MCHLLYQMMPKKEWISLLQHTNNLCVKPITYLVIKSLLFCLILYLNLQNLIIPLIQIVVKQEIHFMV